MKIAVLLSRYVLCFTLFYAFAGGLMAQGQGSINVVQYCVRYSQGPADDPIPAATDPDCDVIVCVSMSYCLKDAVGECMPGTQRCISECRVLHQNEPYCFSFVIPEGWKVDDNSVQYSITPASYFTVNLPRQTLSDEVTTWTPTKCPRSTGMLMKMRNDVLYFWNAHDQ